MPAVLGALVMKLDKHNCSSKPDSNDCYWHVIASAHYKLFDKGEKEDMIAYAIPCKRSIMDLNSPLHYFNILNRFLNNSHAKIQKISTNRPLSWMKKKWLELREDTEDERPTRELGTAEKGGSQNDSLVCS